MPAVLTEILYLAHVAQAARCRTRESLKIVPPEGILDAAQVRPSWGPYDIKKGLQLDAGCAVDWTAM